ALFEDHERITSQATSGATRASRRSASSSSARAAWAHRRRVIVGRGDVTARPRAPRRPAPGQRANQPKPQRPPRGPRRAGSASDGPRRSPRPRAQPPSGVGRGGARLLRGPYRPAPRIVLPARGGAPLGPGRRPGQAAVQNLAEARRAQADDGGQTVAQNVPPPDFSSEIRDVRDVRSVRAFHAGNVLPRNVRLAATTEAFSTSVFSPVLFEG